MISYYHCLSQTSLQLRLILEVFSNAVGTMHLWYWNLEVILCAGKKKTKECSCGMWASTIKRKMSNHIKQMHVSTMLQCFTKQKCPFCHRMFFTWTYMCIYITLNFCFVFLVLSPDSKELVMPIGTLGKVAPTAEGKMICLHHVLSKHSRIPISWTA